MAKKRTERPQQPMQMDRTEMRKALSLMAKVMTVFYGLAIVMFCLAWKYRDTFIALLLCTAAGIFGVAVATLFLITLISARRMRLTDDGRENQWEAAASENIFLSETDDGQEEPAAHLTLEDARDRLHGYMHRFLQGGKLYLANLFEEASHIPEAYKPLFCYDVLLSLSEEDETERWENVLGFGKEFADTFARYLSAAGEEALPAKLQYFVAVYDQNKEKTVRDFRSFVLSREDYIEDRFMAYLHAHIRDFKG